jgi:hypothetical protein
VCRFHIATGEKLHADKQFIWCPCPECHEASKHHLLKFGFLLLVRYTLVSQLREDLLLLIIPSLGVPNWSVIYINTTPSRAAADASHLSPRIVQKAVRPKNFAAPLRIARLLEGRFRLRVLYIGVF